MVVLKALHLMLVVEFSWTRFGYNILRILQYERLAISKGENGHE
jgi:hypothetical protein